MGNCIGTPDAEAEAIELRDQIPYLHEAIARRDEQLAMKDAELAQLRAETKRLHDLSHRTKTTLRVLKDLDQLHTKAAVQPGISHKPSRRVPSTSNRTSIDTESVHTIANNVAPPFSKTANRQVTFSEPIATPGAFTPSAFASSTVLPDIVPASATKPDVMTAVDLAIEEGLTPAEIVERIQHDYPEETRESLAAKLITYEEVEG